MSKENPNELKIINKNERLKYLNLLDSYKQQLKEKDLEIEKLKEELDDKNFCKDFADLYNENRILRQALQQNTH